MLKPVLALQHRNPYPAYWLLRTLRPVLRIGPGRWLVSRHDAVKRVITEHATFSSDIRGFVDSGPGKPDPQGGLASSDPPRHSRLRAFVTKAFTGQAVARMEQRISELTHELIDAKIASGRMDLMEDLASPLPVIVIAELLGIHLQDRAQLKTWAEGSVAAGERILAGGDPLPFPNGQSMRQRLTEIVAQRRAAPCDDLISRLTAAEIEGDRLSDAEVMAFCNLVLIAGNVTSTHLIGNAVRTLLEPHARDALAALRADPALLPGAIEEVLRFRAPVQFAFRTTVRDVELGGRRIPRGARIIALIGSANRDARRFPRPRRFDIHRSPNPHLSFGHGIHYCVGAPLARLEGRIVLGILLQRLRDLRLDGKPAIRSADSALLLHGVRQLPVRFAPSQVSATADSRAG